VLSVAEYSIFIRPGFVRRIGDEILRQLPGRDDVGIDGWLPHRPQGCQFQVLTGDDGRDVSVPANEPE